LVAALSYAGLAFQGAGTVSRLLRARHAINPGEDSMLRWLEEVLDQLGEEWGRDL
jgi:hypothetical protein